MKVIHVVHSANFGGIRTLVRDLVERQSQRDDLSPAILFAKLDGKPPRDFVKTGASIHDAMLTSGYDLSPSKIRRICKIFREHDIVHFHFFNPMFVLAAILSRQLKIVYTFHGLFGFFRKRTPSDRIKRVLLVLFLRSFVDFVSYNSEFTRYTARKMYRIVNKHDAVIYNGVVAEKIRGSREGLPNDLRERLRGKFVVATFGRFVAVKRFDRLLSGFAQFQTGKDDTILLMVGDSILKEELVRLAAHLNISDKTIFTGFQRNVHDYQDAADVCVMSSTNEAFGLVAVEALALGIPIIAFFDGGGLVEVVGGYAGDDIVPDIDGLVQRLEFYYANRAHIRETSNDRKTYAKRFDIQHTETAFFKVYKSLL